MFLLSSANSFHFALHTLHAIMFITMVRWQPPYRESQWWSWHPCPWCQAATPSPRKGSHLVTNCYLAVGLPPIFHDQTQLGACCWLFPLPPPAVVVSRGDWLLIGAMMQACVWQVHTKLCVHTPNNYLFTGHRQYCDAPRNRSLYTLNYVNTWYLGNTQR